MLCKQCGKESYKQDICFRCSLSNSTSLTSNSISLASNSISLTPTDINDINPVAAIINEETISPTTETKETKETKEINIESLFVQENEIIDIPESTYQIATEINRPRNILEIEIDNNHSILSSDDLIKIENRRNESVAAIWRNIESQGPNTDSEGHIIETVLERKRDYLTNHILRLKKEIAELRHIESLNSRERRKIDAEITFNMTDEEKAEFNKRARKISSLASDKTKGKLAKKAEKDAILHIRKEKREGCKLLKQFGTMGIAMAVGMYGFTEAESKRFLETGEI